MNIHLTPRHLKLTASIESRAVQDLTSLTHIEERIISAHAVLACDPTADPAKRFTVIAHLAVAGPDLHAEDTASDLYAALDGVKSKLARQLRKRKTRRTDHRRSRAQRAVEQFRSVAE